MSSYQSKEKFVEFDEYCPTCKYKEVKDTEGKEPCEECLCSPTNIDSAKPIKYENRYST